MSELQAPVWVPTTQEVTDPSMYHRSDDRLVEQVLALNPRSEASICGFYGLRRFGKTSFLRKIEGVAKSRGFETKFVGMQNYARNLNLELTNFERELKVQAEKKDKPSILLLDDFEQLDVRNSKDDRETKLGLTSLTKTLARIFNLASDSKGRTLRIALCEPTNFQDWLDGKIAGVGSAFREIIRETKVDIFSTLPTLDDQEAAHVLFGVPETEVRVDADMNFVREVNQGLGGNPWFLAFAAQVMRENPAFPWEKNKDRLVRNVNETAMGDNVTGMNSIYGSLSLEEKLIVDILYEREQEDGDNKEPVNHMFKVHKGDPWRPAGWPAAARLHELGLANPNVEKRAMELRSPIFIDVVGRALGSGRNHHSVVSDPTDAEKAMWNRLCQSPHPSEVRVQPTIIHQFGDLFFEDNGRSKNWNAYLDWLGEKKVEERPHLIVVCGNLLASWDMDDDDKIGAYRKYVCRALDSLQQAASMLQKVSENESSQIMVVPGVFDLNWSQPDDPKSYSRIWNDEVRKRGFSQPGDVIRFGQANLDVLLFNSVDSGGIQPVGEHAQRDVAKIRALVSKNFRGQWSRLDRGGLAASADLAKYTLEYTFQMNGTESADIATETATFSWHEHEADKGFLKLSEAGFVPTSAIAQMTKHLKASQKDRKGMLPIAVTHHYPRQHRRSSVTEFLNPFHFRQTLANLGVSVILHGHGPTQQCLFEGTPRPNSPRSRGDDPGGTWARAMYLVGSGSFSDKGNLTLHDEEPEAVRLDNPTFNEISITRHFKRHNSPEATNHEGDLYDVRVRFYVAPDSKIEPGSEFSFQVPGSH